MRSCNFAYAIMRQPSDIEERVDKCKEIKNNAKKGSKLDGVCIP